MKPGTRALGIAESYGGTEHAESTDSSILSTRDAASDDATQTDSGDAQQSTVCGAVVRADRVVDGLSFDRWTVGGDDATDALCRLWRELDREDVRYVLVSGIAPAWFNVVDLHRVAAETNRPVISVSFEASDGLEAVLTEQFSGPALDWRLERYRDAPPRQRLEVDGEEVFVRAVGCDDDTAARVVRAFTPEGGRPEPLRVARMAARAAHQFGGN
ncbi:DUF99 family protein [Haloferax namakaokahaiae]|uniref:UPF0215 protein ACFQJC_14080 n=1 Tax=Haloferax namakaokahaiae TaxID=1748331 RepID=A0ABD5ZHD9_9EURY